MRSTVSHGNAAVRLVEGLVLVLAAKRVTRLVTTDWIGEWAVVRPAKKWAYDREGSVDVHLEPVILPDGQLVDPTKRFLRTKAVSGLDCEWCVGVWAAALVAVPLPARLDRIRQPLLTVLAISQGVGMLGQLESLGAHHLEEFLYEMEDDSS